MDHPIRIARFIHPNFRFAAFRMVMKQYRQGKDCNKLLEFLAYRSRAFMEGAQVKQVITTPKIVGERLVMRLQIAYVIPPEGPSRRYLATENPMKCPHTNKLSHRNKIVTERLFQRFATLETVPEGCQEHAISSRCNFCPTEFHFGLQQFEGQGVVLFITNWQDLGTGLSPLDSDLPPVVGRCRNTYIAQRGERLAYESPRDIFEGLSPGEGFQAISALNCEERKDLFRKSDSRLAQFKRIHDSVCWFIYRYSQPWPYRNAPKLVKRSEQILAIARFMEAAESRANPTAFG